MDGPDVYLRSNPFDAIVRDMMEPLAQIGGFMAEQVQEWLSVDVDRTGSKVIRSRPGEHPRRDSGRLFTSITHDIAAQGDVITVTVGTDAPYAHYLENGTSKMAERPILAGLLEQFEPILMNAVAEVIEGDTSTPDL